MRLRLLVGTTLIVLVTAAIVPWTPIRDLVVSNSANPTATIPARRNIVTPSPSSSDLVRDLTQCLAIADARRYDTNGFRAAIGALRDRTPTENQLRAGLEFILQTCNAAIGR